MGDLEMQRLKAVADAARAMRKAANIIDCHDSETDRLDYIVEMEVPARAWEALADVLKVLDKGREMPEMEYEDGPWASTGSDSCVDVAGHWHFPGPDARTATHGANTVAVPNEAETKTVIRIARLKQGFVVSLTDFEDDDLAFTDRVDATEWLLGWLGFEEEITESVRDILAGLWDADELEDRDYRRALGVAVAARAYIEARGLDTQTNAYQNLVEAVKKWRGIEGG